MEVAFSAGGMVRRLRWTLDLRVRNRPGQGTLFALLRVEVKSGWSNHE
jgi:hypothetical protein